MCFFICVFWQRSGVLGPVLIVDQRHFDRDVDGMDALIFILCFFVYTVPGLACDRRWAFLYLFLLYVGMKGTLDQ